MDENRCRGLIGCLCAMAILFLGGCASTPRDREQIYNEINSSTRPVRNLTSMNEPLACFDRLLTEFRVKPIYVTSPGLPSRTGGQLTLASGEDMIISTITRLKSDVFRYVNLGSLARQAPGLQKPEINALDPSSIREWINFVETSILAKSGAGLRFGMPDIVIGGSISQLDENALSKSAGGGLNVPDVGDFGVSRDEIHSLATVDMYLYDFMTVQTINGVSSVNSLLVTRRGQAGNLGARIKAVGLFFDASIDRAEGVHQAIRTLIQLGLIETLGLYAHVPYEQCLQLEPTNPEYREDLQEKFKRLTQKELITLVQGWLANRVDPRTSEQSRFYQGPVTGQLDAPTRDAIARYQQQAGLVPTGEVDFSLYRSLMSPAAAAPAPPHREAPLAVEVTTPRGHAPQYQVNDKLTLRLRVSRDAHVHCFFKNVDNQVLRIFPHLGHRDDFVSASEPAAIPGERPPFEILLDRPTDSEEIGCIASPAPLSSGWVMNLNILQAKPLPVASLQEVLTDYRRGNGDGVVMDVVRIRVR